MFDRSRTRFHDKHLQKSGARFSPRSKIQRNTQFYTNQNSKKNTDLTSTIPFSHLAPPRFHPILQSMSFSLFLGGEPACANESIPSINRSFVYKVKEGGRVRMFFNILPVKHIWTKKSPGLHSTMDEKFVTVSGCKIKLISVQ
jgi:hypothetical protein